MLVDLEVIGKRVVLLDFHVADLGLEPFDTSPGLVMRKGGGGCRE